jgi:hypothetical protein
VFWATSAIGMGVATFGVVGLLLASSQTRPLSWLTFFAGSLIVHDAIWAPAIALGSILLVRILPPWLRAPVQATLIVTAALVLVAIPVLGGFGRLASNPSILPGDYGSDLLKALAVVWVLGAGLSVHAWRRHRRASAGQSSGSA